MDSGVNDADSATHCNGSDSKPYSVEESKEEEEEDDGEAKSLLQSAKRTNGGIKKRQKSSRRRVQWNDRNGNKLVEILEYQPSDSSDSEDEYGDSCICTIM